ncbi:glycerol kinase [Parashewanella spongiae]|uniref:Glycerol kinase n=1 Tax=Parashewanella spongiae TaxID=342950 RepID=A0A3A6TWJ0_9GAMM|nr:glycerol kinase GlpK [Parashewanella spongiae]MCL1077021.1 glycerol kinase GlpK [Parashewanella spongiae]RJY18766.1 glycerol kinase [Parashewanella spongiae]
MTKKYVVALDQGTTSSRAIVFDHNAKMVAQSQREFKQIYPKAGWVEHDPMEIWSSQSSALAEVIARANIPKDQVAAIGITNQRETTIVWDKLTGEPVYNAIVWQCRRSNNICEALKQQGHETEITRKTGLVLDPYFSASKIRWILDHIDDGQQRAERGELLFGSVDSWLIWKLTEENVHCTDPTNAARTMLYNIHTLAWDTELLTLFNIPINMLPEVKGSSSIFGYSRIIGEGANVPIAGVAGDQQSALFGQLCVKPGQAKNTYGTGCFLLLNTGDNIVTSSHGLLTTIAIGGEGEVTYALEGSVFMGGATIQWLRDELGLIRHAKDTEYFATQVENTNNVYLIPAFVGLGAPYWDADARGAIVGLTRGVNRNHIIRAALESIAYQTKDLLDAMEKDSGVELSELNVDGGAVINDFLMQFQADIANIKVIRSCVEETTALGAAFLAGLTVGFWSSIEELKHKTQAEKHFIPDMNDNERQSLGQGWQQAVSRTRTN